MQNYTTNSLGEIKMKVLLTGGSNGIGFAVTEYLAKQGTRLYRQWRKASRKSL